MMRLMPFICLLLFAVSTYSFGQDSTASTWPKSWLEELSKTSQADSLRPPLQLRNDTATGIMVEQPIHAESEVEKPPVETQEPEEQSLLQQRMDALKAPTVSKVITVGELIWSLILILVGYFILKTIHVVLNRIGERSAKYRITVKRLLPVIKIIGWIIVIYIIIQGIIRPPMATVFAFFTSVGVAVGFAAQDLLKNVFGGLMILFDRPFQIGDKIEAGNSYGEVVKIGLRSTRIVTPDDSVVTIPNGEMMNQTISNSNSGETNCQVVAEFFLPLHVDTQKARQIAIESAMVSKYIYLNKPIAVVFFNEMKDRKSILKMRLKAYVSDIRYEFLFKSDMTEITLKELIAQKVINEDW